MTNEAWHRIYILNRSIIAQRFRINSCLTDIEKDAVRQRIAQEETELKQLKEKVRNELCQNSSTN